MGVKLKYRKIHKIIHGVENSYKEKLLGNLLCNGTIYFGKWMGFSGAHHHQITVDVFKYQLYRLTFS